MRLTFLLFLLTSSLFTFSQDSNNLKTHADSLADLEVKAAKWIKELYEGGLTADSDSVYISAEFKKLINDEIYRKSCYPDEYTVEKTVELLKANQIKKAFWFLINIYPLNEKNKEVVTRTLLLYTKVYEVEKIISASFYTYCYTDPTIGTVKNNKPEILHPEMMEKKLKDTNEIISKILFYKSNPPK